MTSEPIYLDGFATTPLAPEARDAMMRALSRPANAGSPHLAGAMAAETVARSRADVASLIGASPEEVFFTSGATESDNLVVQGVAGWAHASGCARRTIIVSAIEHKAVLGAAGSLAGKGFRIIRAPTRPDGVIDIDRLERLIDEDTLLVSLMFANNETGVMQPVAQVSSLAHVKGALCHTDAAQAVGKVPVDVQAIDVDYMSLSAHKMYGPMGIGALYSSTGAPKLEPLQHGGRQEGGLRPGTVPVFLTAGFAAAAATAKRCLEHDATHGGRLVKLFVEVLDSADLKWERTTHDAAVLPGTLSIMIDGIPADDLVQRIAPMVSISAGSACTAGQLSPSHVLAAMGLPWDRAGSVIRIHFGRYNNDADPLTAATEMCNAVKRLRAATGRPRQ